MGKKTSDLFFKLEKLREILVSATSFLLEGYDLSPGTSEGRRKKINSTVVKTSAKDLVTHFDKKVEIRMH